MPGAFNRREVKIREGRIDDLIGLYKSTYRRLTEEILTASEAGRIQKARVMARINVELEALGVDVQAWVNDEIPKYYLDGSNIALQDLRAQGVDISARSNFAVINREAIKALTDDVALSFAQAIRGVSRSANNLLSDATKQQLNFIIADGRLTGDARRTISRNLTAALKEEGLSSLTDRAGRHWSLENYSRMLARTKAVEARNQGLANRMLGLGYDLVQVSNHNSTHEACHVLEGKILSLTGKTSRGTELPGGYVVWGSLQQAIEAGLFHPNCKHAVNTFHSELAAKTKAYVNTWNSPGAVSSQPKQKISASSKAFDTKDDYVYHLDAGNAPIASFAKYGIKPSRDGYSGPGVYMANTEKNTLYYADSTNAGTLYRVNKQKLVDRFGLYPENKDGIEFDSGTGEILLGGRRAIPPEFLQVKRGGGWRDL